MRPFFKEEPHGVNAFNRCKRERRCDQEQGCPGRTHLLGQVIAVNNIHFNAVITNLPELKTWASEPSRQCLDNVG